MSACPCEGRDTGDVDDAPDGRLGLRERTYPRARWHLLFIRTVASGDIIGPDLRTYAVRVVRVLWPPSRGAGLDTGSLLDVVEVFGNLLVWRWRVVWGVRVLGAPNRLRVRPLIYGEDLTARDDAVARAREIARGLSEGRKP
jgi:hypothetical protein